MARTDLDPFRKVVGLIQAAGSSDILLAAATTAGLRVDLSMTQDENYSNTTRLRALLPKVIAAYDTLPEDSQLAATRSVLVSLAQSDFNLSQTVQAALRQDGWIFDGVELVPTEPALREMFFPRGSQWDAFVVIRDLFLEATTELAVMDAYADAVVFQILAARPPGPLAVRVLCSRYAPAVAAEARAFTAQHPDKQIEVRTTRDFHDRFLVLDGQKCIHIGASLNHAGNTAFMISRVEDPANRAALVQSLEQAWNAGAVVP